MAEQSQKEEAESEETFSELSKENTECKSQIEELKNSEANYRVYYKETQQKIKALELEALVNNDQAERLQKQLRNLAERVQQC
jgi:cobalamin biosynthesis protein CobT